MTVLPPLVAGHTPPLASVQLKDIIKPNPPLHATPFGPFPTTSDESESDASGESEREQQTPLLVECDSDPDVTRPIKSPLASQWTGAPIRAIVPLPRRTIALNGSKGPVDSVSARSDSASLATVVPVGASRRLVSWVGQPHVWDDLYSDSEDEDEEDDEGPFGKGPGPAECCFLESITAAEGLAAWSFEELRVECYAQSLIARGTKPPPVIRPSLAIPPAFVPRIVQRELDPNFLVACQ